MIALNRTSFLIDHGDLFIRECCNTCDKIQYIIRNVFVFEDLFDQKERVCRFPEVNRSYNEES
jgi:hypothetical protein